MKTYNNNQEMLNDLKTLKLKRDISIEELKIVKNQFKDDLSFSSWLSSAVRVTTKLGIYNLAKRILK
ncbi:hypothetical protein [Tenacibaculum sp. M341]|uniref:hypothetical protein n=1 Tax=Tenacibaculum sp. M341 TaxID=2530339 RepID=UPI001048DA14|nr:hypothetical protein [Tenacibaculum sp. M341]TCI84661.1 hypothetical protein EYW44_20390 [Tenacibaculum sp. M341]